jgi:hypothetical protein
MGQTQTTEPMTTTARLSSLHKHLLGWLAGAALAGAASGQCTSLLTNPAGTMSYAQSGIMFDVVNVSAEPIHVTGLDQVMAYAGTTAMHVHTKVGTWNGSQLNAAAWTLVGTNPAWVHPGGNVLTPLDIPMDVVIPAGATQGFYVGGTYTGLTDLLAFRHGTNQLGLPQASNGTIEIRTGIVVYYPFALAVGLPTDGKLWRGTVHYCKAASNTIVGAGCGGAYHSFYANHANATVASAALSGNVLRLQRVANGYLGTWQIGAASASYVTPTPAAAVLAVGDDGFVPYNPVAPLPTPYGPQSTLAISANGILGFGPTVDTPGTQPYTPTPAGMLQSTCGGIYAWHDYNPAEIGSGQVVAQQLGQTLFVTWRDVESYPVGVPNRSTLQFQCNLASGDIAIVFLSIDADASSVWGSSHLIGVSAPGASLDPGSVDFATAPLFTTSPEQTPLTLSPLTTPVLGTSWMLQDDFLPANTSFGVHVLGFTDPGIGDLAVIGMPGCGLRASLDVIAPYLPMQGMSVPWGLAIPLNSSLAGLSLYATTAVAQTPATNSFGFVTGNGVRGILGGP